MTNQEFIDGAIRTESQPNAETTARILHPGIAILLREAILKTIEEGDNLDKLKKHIFYGKLMPLPENNTVSPAVAERLGNPRAIRLLHAAIGLATEAAEALAALHSHIYAQRELDVVNLIEEKGDRFWYEAIEADELGISFEEVMRINNHKLRTRYPEKFTTENALTRDLAGERKVLEGK